ncbi:MAG: ABC transporter permease [Chloroflexi bacterium]|nr:ABC transporter permease [Chloroflexota bacterium]
MWRYIGRRLAVALPTLWAVTTLVFFLMRVLPGDPAELLLAQSGASAEAIARLRTQLGLDQPLLVQYGRFLFQILRGDLGRSLVANRPVVRMIGEQLPATLELALAAMGIAVVLGLALGLIAALRRGTWVDSLCMTVAVVGSSLPVFWSGLLFILFFSIALRWLPATGEGTWRHLLMPAAVLGIASSGSIARQTRSSVLETLGQEYVTAARAKGLREWMVLTRHVLRNALIPVATVIGLRFSFLLGGTVVTETVFSRRGLGRLIVDGILWKDFPVVQGVVLLVAAIYVLVNLFVDVSYALLDPRVRYD